MIMHGYYGYSVQLICKLLHIQIYYNYGNYIIMYISATIHIVTIVTMSCDCGYKYIVKYSELLIYYTI